MIHSILVVCRGNICRSPMGEGLLKQMLPDVDVMSAGLEALDGDCADPAAVELMLERGLDISEHRSRRLNAFMVSTADLVLVMDKTQKQYVERRYVAARGKVFRVCEANAMDVTDPYRLGRRDYSRALGQITEGVSAWASKICLLDRVIRKDTLAVKEA